MTTLAETHTIYVEAIRSLMGEDGLKAIGEANRLHGLELGKNAVEQGDLRVGDFRSIYEFFEGAHSYFGFKLSIEELTDKRFDLKVTYCPWLEGFKNKNASSDICWWVTKIDEGIGQAVDPDLRMTLPKCMMRGDEYCIYRWEKE
ncbi:MAG: L-2-amino-thiazoline-4-carboxylic acid hydrolase [Candidatus Thorarchaeota archaeon]